LNDEQIKVIEKKQMEISVKKERTNNQTIADYLEGYNQALQWCKENV